MRFLITGITGFVGPHLANLLIDEGHTVYGLVRGSNGREKDLLDVITSEKLESIIWIYGDLLDYCSMTQMFKNYQFDGVFHLAAQSHVMLGFEHPKLTYENNVMGSINLLTAIEEYQQNCHVHFCSTSEVYGDVCKGVGILSEDTKLAPCNPYGSSKASIDFYMQERIQNKKISGFITRAFSHTGPRRGYKFSISSDAFQIAKMLLGLQKNVLLIGNLDTERVVMDVRDCVRAYYMLMMKKASGAYNVCTVNIHKMRYFTDLLIEVSGLKDIVQEIYPAFYRSIDIQVQRGDITRLRRVIDWEPKISIQQTMSDLLSYWVVKLRKNNG